MKKDIFDTWGGVFWGLCVLFIIIIAALALYKGIIAVFAVYPWTFIPAIVAVIVAIAGFIRYQK